MASLLSFAPISPALPMVSQNALWPSLGSVETEQGLKGRRQIALWVKALSRFVLIKSKEKIYWGL